MLDVLAAAKEISIETNLDAGIPVIRGDAAKIARVIANLVGNAIKFSPRGSCIHVHAGVREGALQVTVRDEGDGIPSDQLARVFDRFWTGHPAQERGAGLGLAIARGIIEEHGGRIWATSQLGAGSTFTFSLPVAERSSQPAHGNGGRA
jgi:signal transduction histidine kinase